MTPEQVAEAVSAVLRMPLAARTMGEEALLAEHERAERMAAAATREAIARTNAALNAQDAARWRAVREEERVVDAVKDVACRRSSDGYWPATVDEAADRLIREAPDAR